MSVDQVLSPGHTPLGAFAEHGTAPALVTRDGVLTYSDLADLVRSRAAELGPVRRLVMVACSNDVEPVVAYLAALAGGHAVLLVPDDRDAADIVATYAPDVVLTRDDEWRLQEHRAGTMHDLHPDLALLLSTSGSTGSPKLVRLSHDNIRANAQSIADYLGLTADDRAATTLPFHYCYGLSVLNSHLLTGASLLLTDRSVVEEEFWAEFADAGATSFAGVPYTFDLLDASGFANRELPTLRRVTQAGGRLDPQRVRDYARLGRERGFDLVVMYGQTEATARMAYLPPHLAEHRPDTIGVPIPGGSFRIDPLDGAGRDVGELVYSGPNVMLGYAETPADLARGRYVHELRTGDLARQHEDGLYELVGRRSRFAKVFGLRVDLDRVERAIADAGVPARVVGPDERLDVFVLLHSAVDVARHAISRLGLPASSARVHVIESFPVTSSGKPDHAALVRHAVLLDRPADLSSTAVTPSVVRDLYAELLGRPDATEEDSFVALQGDSLSYVEVTVRLSDLVGTLPKDWPSRSPRELAELRDVEAPPARRRWGSVEMPVLLRGLAIVLVVGTHANVLSIMGGAHLLLGLVGFNLARFQVADSARPQRVRSLLRAARQVWVPSAVWIGGVALVSGTYDVPTALMLNGLLGSDTWDTQWQFWFLEVVVWSLVGVAALLAIPRVHALERRTPFGFAAAVVGVTLALRYLLVGVEAGPYERYTLPVVLWCVALGWLIERARTRCQRVGTSCVVVVSVAGLFGDPVREGLVAAGLLVLVWVRSMPAPRYVVRTLGVLASASLFVYLTHWQVYPHLEMEHPWLATLSSFAVGIVVWRAYNRLTSSVRLARVLALSEAAGAMWRRMSACASSSPWTAATWTGLRRSGRRLPGSMSKAASRVGTSS